MGQSTDAILAYGYDLNALDEYGEIDLEEFLAEEVRDAIAQVPDHYDLQESIPDWLRTRDCDGVDIITHCSCDYTMYILGLQAARAWRGDIRRLDLSALINEAVTNDWVYKVKRAAEALKIDVKDQTPGWLLVSMWC